MIITGQCCPACMVDVEYELWCEDFECFNCGVMLCHHHECEIDDCYDYLELVDE